MRGGALHLSRTSHYSQNVAQRHRLLKQGRLHFLGIGWALRGKVCRVIEAKLLERATVLAQAQRLEEALYGRRLLLLVKHRRSVVGNAADEADQRPFLNGVHSPAWFNLAHCACEISFLFPCSTRIDMLEWYKYFPN